MLFLELAGMTGHDCRVRFEVYVSVNSIHKYSNSPQIPIEYSSDEDNQTIFVQ